MKVLISSLLLLLPIMLMSVVSSSPNPGKGHKSHRDQCQAFGRWLQAGGQDCECKDWFLRAPKRKLMTVPGLPKNQCPCDHFKGNVKKTRHQRNHRKSNKHSRGCQHFSNDVS
ncbi:C-X-C motif chemokine 17-like [Diceros bicornis minor]|uniref:C-X-C motif chemokine 17-like n=1 Tax=Diceros bicornis minor TaxID=77932 RepID=UPI0026F0C45A|nr:C-X-C motif chemokine 17-like [Diceros bicornis minor]